MSGIISNIIQNSVGGMVAGAVTTIGGYAGDAVGGIGNMIESAGRSVGEGMLVHFPPNREGKLKLLGGINRTIAGVGSSINSYGDAAVKATAPNAPGYSSAPKTAVKKPEPSKKEPAKREAAKKEPPKALPSTASVKALPSSKPMKALPAPPSLARSKSADSVTTRASTTATQATKKPYDPTHSSYKPTGSSYSSPAAKKPEPKKPLPDGKVRIAPESRPGGAPAAAAAAPKPFQPYRPDDSKGYSPSYRPPKPRLTETNLKAVPSSAPHIPGYAPSAAGSVKSGVSRAQGGTQKGAGGRTGTAAQPSKAGSVAGSVKVDRQFF